MTTSDIDDLDRASLQLSLDLTLAEPDPLRVRQVEEMLRDSGWRETCEFCSYHQQMRSLNLRPWQLPPSRVDERDPGAARTYQGALARRMRAKGISKYHPDPAGALDAANRKSAFISSGHSIA